MVTRWSDIDRMFGAMGLLQSRLDNMFSDAGRLYGPDWSAGVSMPATNLYDTGESFKVRCIVPGLSKDDLNVKIQGNYLEAKGGRKADTPEGYTAHRVERPTTSFSRSFTLPADVDSEKAEASLKDGILTLNLPKAEAGKPKQVTIS